MLVQPSPLEWLPRKGFETEFFKSILREKFYSKKPTIQDLLVLK